MKTKIKPLLAPPPHRRDNCPHCLGFGKHFNGVKCTVCKGTGKQSKVNKVQILNNEPE